MNSNLNLNATPSASRLQIALFGRRNAGKSSLINCLTGQRVALVSEHPGTTTDPVVKAMEILPLGPVVLIDTAGLDDEGPLGDLRVKRTLEVLNRTDLAILVLDGQTGITDWDRELLKTLRSRQVPVVGVVNKVDLPEYQPGKRLEWQNELQLDLVEMAAQTGQGLSELKMALIRNAPQEARELSLVRDIIKPGQVCVLVVPIDSAAPKGRLILPQQQVIRELLDHGCMAVVTREHELKAALDRLKEPPALVVTDSQAFSQVAADIPAEVELTSFSILFARYKGDLPELVKGAVAIQKLRPGDRVLIVEGCTHHRQSDDIGTVKIPRWLRQFVGGDLQFEWASGLHLPHALEQFHLVVHCGACMLNRREMQYRISLAQQSGTPIVNYGVLIAYVNGLFPRALKPFSELKPFWEAGGGA